VYLSTSTEKKPQTWAEIITEFKTEIGPMLEQKLEEKLKQFQAQNPIQFQQSVEMDDPFKHVHECPTCSAKLEKEKEDFAHEFMQKLLKERKDKKYECEGCGLGVGEEEEKCPSCGGTKARIRRSF